MSLKTQIDEDIKQAMRNKNKEELAALRSIKSMILLAETEKGNTGELQEETELKLLTKAANQRRESMTVFREQGRDELADKEEAELQVIERYLPKQLTEDEMRAEIDKIIQQTGANSSKDMGKVMGMASKNMAGRADGKAVAAMVKSMLAQMG
jgi:uncharacterized protein YqeY